MTLALTRRQIASLTIIDTVAVAMVLLIPAFSHLVAFPLHAFEPMRIILFSVILFLPQRKWNAITIALLLPLVSFAVSGHPVFPKNILMSAELALNVFIYYAILSRTRKYSVSILISMLISKVSYYMIKYLLISVGVLKMDLFSTSIWFQIILVVLFSMVFLINDFRCRVYE